MSQDAPRPTDRTDDAAPRLLSGGNPQISQRGGRSAGAGLDRSGSGVKGRPARRLDALIVESVPGVRKAVKWKSPLYGVEPGTWFLSLHCFDRTVKVTFFKGARLEPPPPGPSKMPEVRCHDVGGGGVG
ncbi:DUF1801 domain-containing protein [Rubellimicrobium rubrum]|uniref:DUF1801 domain-containing protein n=1 Tax=Rubellimicrobium rubrum TaxID=2585369 RepID=UPI001FEB3E5A|nr:DUF1801 domain-containing protein [Rubellimicrobium rubrum]